MTNDFRSSIDTALTQGYIYNVDFIEIKDTANRNFEKEVRNTLREPFFHSGKWESRTELERSIDNAIGFSLHIFPSKKLMKIVNNHMADLGMANGQPSDYINAVLGMIASWGPVRDSLKTLKPTVIKGRKPSSNPRATPERTIENTGTCAVCGKNVKLADGKIVAHGYTIRYGFQSGNCAGVDYDPIEISPEGASAYLYSLNLFKIDQEYALTVAIAAAVDTTDRKVKYAPDNIQSMIRTVTRDIEMYTGIVEKWEAKALPGA